MDFLRDVLDIVFAQPNGLVRNQLAQQNLSLSRQEVPEIHFGWFLALVFATRVLQNHMFCQALGTEKNFRGVQIQITWETERIFILV